MKKKQTTDSVQKNLIVLAVSFLVAFGVGFLLVNQFKDAILKAFL